MNQHLVLLDFDGTIANTFKDSPRGLNVGKASRLAIREVFGRNGALAFDEIGGLRNREPGELVKMIKEMTRSAYVDLAEATEQFVQTKLSLLIPEISSQWPELYPGAAEFLQKAGRDGYWVDIGILSSGHDDPIRRVLEVNGIGSTDLILVTSDLLRQREMPQRARYKPHTYQFAEAHRQWLVQRSLLPRFDGLSDGEQYLGRALGKPNILYVGDDPVKDGGLAREARAPFIFVPFTQPGFEPQLEKGQLGVVDFDELDDVLDYQHGDELGKGRSFAEALFGRRDSELFPPLPDGEVYRRILKERSFS